MIDGLWILNIETPQYTSGGVVVFVKGKVLGGDNGFTWVGTYLTDGKSLKGRVNVHNFDPNINSIFGMPGDYDLHFSGTLASDVITGTAMLAGQPQHSLGITLIRRAGL